MTSSLAIFCALKLAGPTPINHETESTTRYRRMNTTTYERR